MTTVIVDTRTIGSGEHEIATLTPVRSGELRKVSARCACGWRTVGIARELDDAAAIARTRAEQHAVAELEAALASTSEPAPRRRGWFGLARG